MRMMMCRTLLVAAAACGMSSVSEAGWPWHRRHAECDFAAPVVHMAPVADCGCTCAAVSMPCCGIGGGIAQIGTAYSLGTFSDAGISGGAVVTGDHGAGNLASGLTGYEGLPNMDGGGVNHRYPYHSYRRPWAHPGPRSSNVSIVW